VGIRKYMAGLQTPGQPPASKPTSRLFPLYWPGMISNVKPDLVTRIAAAFDLQPKRIFAPQSGYRNRSYRINLAGSQTANLIIYKSEPGILNRIRRANALGNFLASQGLPARTTLDPRILRLTANPVRYAALYRYLPGDTIPWEAYTMEHLKALGATMAHLHATLRSAPQANLPLVSNEYLAISSRMQTYFADPGVSTAIIKKLRITLSFQVLPRYEQLLRVAGRVTIQPLHMDFVRGNILFATEAATTPVVTGILDFEKAALGHPAFDLARTLAFLLVDCKFKSETQIRKYFLYSGYHKRGGGVLPNPKLLEALIDLFLLYDFYKFLRHNPYESLHRNEHFIRTSTLLLERRILHELPAPV
jgi:Ser/Thr protein kinase RdoA (MazF antagonist)